MQSMGYGSQTISFPKKENKGQYKRMPSHYKFLHPEILPHQATRCNIDKLSKPRKINMGYHPTFSQQNWLSQTREAEVSSQAPIYAQPPALAVILTQQPATVSAVPTKPLVTMSDQIKKSYPGYCAKCTPVRKQSPKDYPMPLKSD